MRFFYLWPCIIVGETFLYSSFPTLINLGRINGNVEFQSSAMWLSVEILKLLLAVAMASSELLRLPLSLGQLNVILPFSVPALCYCMNNNLAVLMQDEMDPSTFQVLCNLKMLSTAVLYRMIMKRKLSQRQWLSLLILCVAGGLNSHTGLNAKTYSLRDIHLTVKGAVLMVVYCTSSGFAGVFTEYMLKQDIKGSLALKNCYMYSFGVLLNLILFFHQSNIAEVPVFHGFTKYTWAAVCSQALNGLIMSFIMKHGSNIIRLFVIASAVPLTALLSATIFHTVLGVEFLTVLLLVVFALCLYHFPADVVIKRSSTAKYLP